MLEINTYGSFVQNRLIPLTIPEVICELCIEPIPLVEQPILSCGHDNNCRPCLEHWWVTNPNRHNGLTCPICRDITRIHKIGVEMEQANDVDMI